jgi:hypothetical protein
VRCHGGTYLRQARIEPQQALLLVLQHALRIGNGALPVLVQCLAQLKCADDWWCITSTDCSMAMAISRPMVTMPICDEELLSTCGSGAPVRELPCCFYILKRGRYRQGTAPYGQWI